MGKNNQGIIGIVVNDHKNRKVTSQKMDLCIMLSMVGKRNKSSRLFYDDKDDDKVVL